MKITDVKEIREKLISIQEGFLGPLKVKVNKPGNYELSGTIEAQQGKKTVDGIYFSSIVPKEKDVRFYFFPSYTHADQFDFLSETMSKFKKGKSCFHVKYLDNDLEKEIKKMMKVAVKAYKKDGLLAK